ncbi:MAG: hypothetical protein CBC58_04015 [Cellulomonadaceae bacterium TMED98]|nr:MAG: hypothetical protein CBC58_04015 [Cellulomonadaceae bacterium TMED98]
MDPTTATALPWILVIALTLGGVSAAVIWIWQSHPEWLRHAPRRLRPPGPRRGQHTESYSHSAR